MSKQLDEKSTREQLINKQLRAAGWIKKYIKEEVNSISKKDFDLINKKSLVHDEDIMPMIGTIEHPIIVKKIKNLRLKMLHLLSFQKQMFQIFLLNFY